MKAMRSFTDPLIFVPTNQSEPNKPSDALNASTVCDWERDADSFPSDWNVKIHLNAYFCHNIRYFGRLEYPRLKLDTLLFVKVLYLFIYFSCEVTNVGYKRFYRLPTIKITNMIRVHSNSSYIFWDMSNIKLCWSDYFRLNANVTSITSNVFSFLTFREIKIEFWKTLRIHQKAKVLLLRKCQHCRFLCTIDGASRKCKMSWAK